MPQCSLQDVFTAIWSGGSILGVSASAHGRFQERVQTQTSAQWYSAGITQSASHDNDPHFGLTERRMSEAQTCEHVYATGAWGPIRIGYELIYANASPTVTAIVMNNTMPRAVGYWASALEVIQATKPLMLDRHGENCSKFPWEKEYVCQSVQTRTCGVDLVPIPERYLRSFRTCGQRCSPGYYCYGDCFDKVAGSCNCDFQEWDLKRESYCCQISDRIADSCPNCSIEKATFPNHESILCETCADYPEGEGAVNEDVHIFVTIDDTIHCGASEGSDTAAYTTWCEKDQCDRPIFIVVNFCPSMMSYATEQDLNLQVSVAIHELAHGLVFSSGLFRYFRYPDGSPRIPRNIENLDMFPGFVRWSCFADGIPTFPDPTGNKVFVDISPEIVSVISARGLTNCECPLNGVASMGDRCIVAAPPYFRQPHCIVAVTTPTVIAEAKCYFDCDSIEGAELENQDTSHCAIIGDHWESRVFRNEIMATHVTAASRISRVTLALFQDSGWYKVNYSRTDRHTKGLQWGYKEGCGFAKEKCVERSVPSSPLYFCTDSSALRCSFDRRGVDICAINQLLDTNLSNVPGLNYLPDNLLGTSAELDYCPSYDLRLTNRVCTDVHSSNTMPYDVINAMREVFSVSSRCLESDLRGNAPDATGAWYSAEDKDFGQPWPACYNVECSPAGLEYTVRISDLENGTVEFGACKAQGQKLSRPDLKSLKGEISCADPAVMCAEHDTAQHYGYAESFSPQTDACSGLPSRPKFAEKDYLTEPPTAPPTTTTTTTPVAPPTASPTVAPTTPLTEVPTELPTGSPTALVPTATPAEKSEEATQPSLQPTLEPTHHEISKGSQLIPINGVASRFVAIVEITSLIQ